jgi:hypothetical protein
MLKASAKMARHFADKYGIPKTRSTTPGILGHNEIKSTTCPGTLPWDEWMNYFNGGDDIRLYSSINVEPYPIVQGSPVTVTVKIANYSSDTFKGNIAAALHTTSGQYLGDIGREDNETIDAKSARTYTFSKSTIISDPGDYQLQIKYESASAGISWDEIPAGSYTNPLKVRIIQGTTTQPDDSNNNDYSWTGNGSIISYHGSHRDIPTDGDYPFGITQDVTVLQPNLTNPVGFFQWQADKQQCNRLEIFTNNTSVQRANITLGPWSSREKDVIFRNVTLPFVIGENNTGFSFGAGDSNWYVLSVAFNGRVSEKTELYAKCTTRSTGRWYDSQGNYPVILDGGYQWNGNASILSHRFRTRQYDSKSSDWPFGAFQDVTQVRPSSNKPVIFFQWHLSNSCQQLNLKAVNQDGYSRNESVKISAKYWNGSQSKTVTQRLPVTFYPSSAGLNSSSGNWIVLKMAFERPVTETIRIEATCPGF